MNDLKKFLSEHVVEKTKIFSHTSKKGLEGGLNAARYFIADDELPTFFKYYQYAAVNKNNPLLTLLEKPGEFTPLRIDFDILTPPDETCSRKYNENIIKQIISVIQNAIKQLVEPQILKNEHLICIVLEKTKSRVEDKHTKDGFHLHFPYFICEDWVQNNYIYEKMNDAKVQDLFLTYNITNRSKLIDKNMARKTWMMYGSSNVKNCDSEAYLYHNKAYDHELNKIKLKTIFSEKMQGKRNSAVFYLPQFLSVRGYTKPIEVIQSFKEKYAKVHYNYKPKTIEKTRSDDEIIADLSLIKNDGIMNMLANHRADERDEWMEVGWTIFNIGQGSEDALKIWKDFSSRSVEYSEESCEREWAGMKMGNKTLGSLLYMAKLDSPALYEKWQTSNYKQILQKSLHFTILKEGHLDKVMAAKYGSTFRCADCANKIWYQFKDHRWRMCDDTQELGNKIIQELTTDYFNLKAELTKRQAEGDENTREKLKPLVENCGKVISAFKTGVFVKKLINYSMYNNQLYDGNFEKKLNSDKSVIACENGVLDLRFGIFRDGRPDDYVSISTGVHYNPHPDQEDINRVRKIFQQIFPNPRINKYFWFVASSCLEAGNVNKKIFVFVGGGNNGKTVTMLFLDEALGDYFGTFGNSLIEKGAYHKSSEPRPELIDASSKNLMVFNEIKDTKKLDIGLLKLYSGGDKVGGVRDLYQKGKGKKKLEIKQDYTLFLQCNTPPPLPGDDDAFWYRIRLIPCDSKFLLTTDAGYEDIPDDEEEQMKQKLFKADKRLKIEIKSLGPVLLYELFRIFILNKDKDLEDPPEVTDKTKTYRSSNDLYMQFITKSIQPGKEDDKISSKVLYGMFETWYKEEFPFSSLDRKISKDKFDEQVRKRVYLLSRESKLWKKCAYNDAKRFWTGIIRKENIDEEVQDAVGTFLRKN
ncbi:MAG TPA: PriCT-2 domain-containing protein [Nitrosarchaeum sp.]|nr:PriCT-2 domain-containing protein [Nitrosarchaeum sp.]